MRKYTMSFVLFFIVNTTVLAQTSGPHGGISHTNDGTARSNPTLSTGTEKSRNLSHSGVIVPHATNDKGVIPANPSTDNDMRNPGSSQSLITHAEPQSLH
jgi:hypothetical protein